MIYVFLMLQNQSSVINTTSISRYKQKYDEGRDLVKVRKKSKVKTSV